MEERLDIFNEDGQYAGTALRSAAHRDGLWHQVVQCWVVSREEQNVWLYFQQRSANKEDFPNLYDLAVGGHIGAGESPQTAAVREIREEIGLRLSPNELEYLGDTREIIQFPDFFDREIARVFYYEAQHLPFQVGEEVSRMIRVSLEDYLQWDRHQTDQLWVYPLDGRPILSGRNDWCIHEGVFEPLILPRILKKR